MSSSELQRFAMRPMDAALHRLGRPASHRLLYGMAIALVVLLVWAGLADVDEMTRGLGRVVPSQRVQVVQHLEGGILREMLVREGQMVARDDVLLRIENEGTGSRLRDNVAQMHELQASMARLTALADKTSPTYPEEIARNYGLVQRHTALLEAERRTDAAEAVVLETQRQLREEEVIEQQERRRHMVESLQMVERQRDTVAPLVRSGSYSQIDFMELQQKTQRLAGDLAILDTTIPRLQTAAREARERVEMYWAGRVRDIRAEIHKIGAELASLQEENAAIGDRVSRMDVRSPVRGIVKKLYMLTEGAVVRPGETILELVPVDDTLVIEAQISPTDIAFIHKGQKAMVRLTAYDASLYGALEGVVEQISADTLDTSAGEPYYLVKILLVDAVRSASGSELPVLPGMMAQVDILTGEKSVLTYLLKPLLKAQQEALRER